MAQNVSTGLPVIAKPIGRKQDLAACRILLICMIPKFVPILPSWSNFGNGVSGAAFPLKVANNIPRRTNRYMNLNIHAGVIYTLRSKSQAMLR